MRLLVGSFRSRLPRRFAENMNRAFERHNTIAASKKMAYKTPIQRSVCPDTNPQAATIGRDEELLATEQEADIGGVQPEGDRWPSLDPLECSKRSFTGAEIRMTPRTDFTGLGE